jgi:type 1 glutamine amidotransferase
MRTICHTRHAQFGAAWLLAGLALAPASAVSGEPAPPSPPARRQVEAVLARPLASAPKLRIVLLADKKDHGAGEHDYPLWQQRWALLLSGGATQGTNQVNLFGAPAREEKSIPQVQNVEVVCAGGWPSESDFATADVIVAFCYLPWTEPRRQQLGRYLDRGGGLVLIHSATWTMPQADPAVAKLVGVGGFSRFRHGPVELEITATDHPICRGLPRRVSFYDETYWPPTPPIDPARVTVLAVSREAEESQAQATSLQPLFWTCLSGRGRVFGCVLGHYTWTFDDPWFRLLLLRGIGWAADQPVSRLEPLALRGARVADP